MRKTWGILILATLIVAPSMAQKVTIDYAHDYDFESIKTFQYVQTKDTDVDNPLMDERIKNAVIKELQEGGLQLVDSGADIAVTYHFTSQDNTVYNTTNFGYGGYWGGWGGWGGGMGSSTTTASTYTEGTMILDAYDMAERKMIWRGTGTVTVKEKPEKQMKQVDNILDKIGNKWDKILKNMGE